MTLRQLAYSSARFHLRAHLGVILGTALASAVLIGALNVGDSVKASLRQRALEGVGANSHAISSGERYFSDGLWPALGAPASGFALLEMPATATRGDGARLVNHARIFGVDSNFPALFSQRKDAPIINNSDEGVWINPALAQQIGVGVGEQIVLRLAKPSALSRDAIITARNDATVAWRVTVQGILPPRFGGNLAIRGSSSPAVFADRSRLARLTGLEGRANFILADAGGFKSPSAPLPDLQKTIRQGWSLGDAELSLRSTNERVELVTRRIFLESSIIQAALTNSTTSESPVPVLTYLVNSLRHDNHLTPYSMVTAAGPPYTPLGLRDDEIVLNDWLAQDLAVKPGDTVSVAYYRADAGTQLVESTNRFRVHSIVPLTGIHGDRTLMPEFPGLTKAESTHDWDAGFDLLHTIRDQDETYWKQYRGTPKAFITLAAGQNMWSNRFGNLTAIRWFNPDPASRAVLAGAVSNRILQHLDPAAVGLQFEPVREQALAAASSGTGNDFGGLFLSLSFFLIVSALLLTALLFRFGLEQRATELGALLALGWRVRQVRRLYGAEGFVLATAGTLLGALLGVLYGLGVIFALNTVWRAAVGGAELQFAVKPLSVAGGIAASILIAMGTLWWTLRNALRRPARELLNEGLSDVPAITGSKRRWELWTISVLAVAAVGLATSSLKGAADEQQKAFFIAGMLLLIAGLLSMRTWLRRLPAPHREPVHSLSGLASRAPARRPARSLATITLLAVATFLIVAIAAYRLDATRDAGARSAGTGGFALWGESTLPVQYDLNTRKGREFYGLNPRDMTNVAVVAMRVQAGDEASCLNLNRAQRPRLLGVRPADLAERRAFTFTSAAPGSDLAAGWNLLVSSGTNSDEVPAIGDAQSIQWALGKKLGDTIDYVGDHGESFRVRLVGAVANSILQGSLLIDEAQLMRHFSQLGGYRAFLIDVTATGSPANRASEVSRIAGLLSRSLSDVGLEVTTTTARLAQFNAVQNTYLSTFQVLGGLGLILGSAGLGVVVLRNVFERRGELAVMSAVGVAKAKLSRMVSREHALLLILGLGTGLGAAVVAVMPAWWNSGGGFPWVTVAITLAVVLLNGLIWTWLATRRAMSGDLLAALRGE